MFYQFFPEEEFLSLAEDLRPHMQQAMKIEVAPWIKDYAVDMDELYTELTLEKLGDKPFKENNQKLKNYQEMFQDNSENEEEMSEETKDTANDKDNQIATKGCLED